MNLTAAYIFSGVLLSFCKTIYDAFRHSALMMFHTFSIGLSSQL